MGKNCHDCVAHTFLTLEEYEIVLLSSSFLHDLLVLKTPGLTWQVQQMCLIDCSMCPAGWIAVCVHLHRLLYVSSWMDCSICPAGWIAVCVQLDGLQCVSSWVGFYT